MSHFSNALHLALQELGWTQTAFARACNLPLPQLNKYVRGRLSVSIATMTIVARALPDAQRAEVVAAWLFDAIPQSAHGLVSIGVPGATARESPEESAALLNLHPDLDQALRFLIEAARSHTEIADLMIDLEKALRGSQADHK